MSALRAVLILGGLAIAACHETTPPTAPAPPAPHPYSLTAALPPGEVPAPCSTASNPGVPTANELREHQPGIADDEIEAQIAEAEAANEVSHVDGALIVRCSRPATSP
jgi:hypothetical protein